MTVSVKNRYCFHLCDLLATFQSSPGLYYIKYRSLPLPNTKTNIVIKFFNNK
jgi:hypothetical protein